MSTLYSDALLKVQVDLDMQDESFVTSSEFLNYFNDSKREATQDMMTLFEDYFLTKTNIALITGQSLYSLPSDIYGQKIRQIIYQNADLIYEIKRLKSSSPFLDRHIIRFTDPTDFYRYTIYNDPTSGFQIELSPAAKETSSTNVTLYYLRTPSAIVNTTDYVDADMPGALNFIYVLVKGKIKQKENMGTMPADARAEIEMQRKLFVETMSSRIPDDDNEVVKEMRVYWEHS